jgi:hypothetical protein
VRGNTGAGEATADCSSISFIDERELFTIAVARIHFKIAVAKLDHHLLYFFFYQIVS